jgi:hypothetical protein
MLSSWIAANKNGHPFFAFRGLEFVFHGEKAVFYMEEFSSLILSHGRYIQWNSFSLPLGNMALLIVQHFKDSSS